MATHYDIVNLRSVESTQDVAREAIAKTGRATLVVADRQVAGRGRAGRTWLEPTIGMFSSFAFAPDGIDVGPIPLSAGVAVRRAIGREDVDLKWPNDLLIGGAKVGGILVEATTDTVVVGCGVNLWWPDAPEYAAAVHDERPVDAVAGELANGWVGELLSIFSKGAWPVDEYRASCVTIGSQVRWDGGVGRALDVGDDGTLIVDGGEGPTRVLSGDVHLLPLV